MSVFDPYGYLNRKDSISHRGQVIQPSPSISRAITIDQAKSYLSSANIPYIKNSDVPESNDYLSHLLNFSDFFNNTVDLSGSNNFVFSFNDISNLLQNSNVLSNLPTQSVNFMCNISLVMFNYYEYWNGRRTLNSFNCSNFNILNSWNSCWYLYPDYDENDLPNIFFLGLEPDSDEWEVEYHTNTATIIPDSPPLAGSITSLSFVGYDSFNQFINTPSNNVFFSFSRDTFNFHGTLKFSIYYEFIIDL